MTEQEYRVQLQRTRNIFVKVNLLDLNENIVGNIEGEVIGGSCSIDGDSSYSRTCSLEMVIRDSSFLPKQDSKIWLDKKIIPYLGVKDETTEEIIYYSQGIYYLSNPTITSGNGELTLSLTGLDKMCLLNGQISGSLQYKTKIEANAPIFGAVKSIVAIDGETKIMISDTDNLVIPYEILKTGTDTIESILAEIRGLYAWFEYFYDKDGYFIYRKIKDRKNDSVVWNFEENDLVLNYNNSPNWDNIKNDIVIWGKLLEDKTQPFYHLENNDLNSPFSIDKIGRRKMTVNDDNIRTNEQAQLRAEYEAFIHGNLCEEISFSCPTIYTLEVNNVIQVKNEASGIDGRYRVKSIVNNFKNGLSDITANKLYYEV